MRIIAGQAGGLELSRPPADVRPTMDRVRAAIFSSLGDAVPGARVKRMRCASVPSASRRPMPLTVMVTPLLR